MQWTVVENQDAESAILETARSWQPDLITMATRKSSGFDRWLSGSVTDAIIRSAGTPVLVVPPNWERPFGRDFTLPTVPADRSAVVRFAPDWPQPLATERPARILLALDGSGTAEQALVPGVRLASLTPANLILLRVTGTEAERNGAEEYIRRMEAELESALPGQHVTSRVTPGKPVQAILDTACEFDVDAIAMSTRGVGGLARAVPGSTATGVLEQSCVPLLLVGPRALRLLPTARIQIRARVRTLDHVVVGEVHRVVVDLEQQAVVGVVVLGRGPLARDVLVPADFIESVANEELLLRLTGDEVERLPDFSYNDFVTPPPETWTSFVPVPDGPILIPVSQRKRLGPAQHEITPGTRVRAEDGDVGAVQRIEVDQMGRLLAFWVRTDGVFAKNLRVPCEWLRHVDVDGNLLVAGTRADIEAHLGYESRLRGVQ